MKYSIFLWLLIWAGMYSNVYSARSLDFSSMSIFGLRIFLPLVVIFLCLLSVFVSGFRKFPTFRTPLELLFYYCIIGIIAAFFSPEILVSLYWGILFLSPIIVTWYAMNKGEKSIDNIRGIININYVIFIIFMLIFLPRILESGISIRMDLPFGLGEVNRNGIARYALVVFIFSFTRVTFQKRFSRYFYLILAIPALYIIYQSQSRSALLGLATAITIIFYLKGFNWRLIVSGPIFSYLIWISGFQLRSKGELERLVFLTGREYTWQRGLEQIGESPIYGWGFQADRVLLEFGHMHNSYLQALIQSGILGAFFFIYAIAIIWLIIFHYYFKDIKNLDNTNKTWVAESIALIGFLTVRSFFESTAAFYGVDLLLLVPILGYLQFLLKKNKKERKNIKDI